MADYAFIVCELAAAFAGFTAIVSALDSRSAETRRLDRARLRSMLEVSLFAVVGGLAPILLGHVGLAGNAPWQAAAAMMSLGGAILFRIQFSRGFSQEIQAQPGYSLAYARLIAALGAGVLACFTIATVGVLPDGLYLVALTLALVIAALQFLRTASSMLDE